MLQHIIDERQTIRDPLGLDPPVRPLGIGTDIHHELRPERSVHEVLPIRIVLVPMVGVAVVPEDAEYNSL